MSDPAIPFTVSTMQSVEAPNWSVGVSQDGLVVLSLREGDTEVAQLKLTGAMAKMLAERLTSLSTGDAVTP